MNLYVQRARTPDPLSLAWQRRLLSRELYSEEIGVALCARGDLAAESVDKLINMPTNMIRSTALANSPSVTAHQMNRIARADRNQVALPTLVSRGGLTDATLARLRFTATHPELLLALATSPRTPVDEQRRLLIKLLSVTPASTLMYEPLHLTLSAFVRRNPWSYDALLLNCRDVMQAALIADFGAGASSAAVIHLCRLIWSELTGVVAAPEREDRLALTHLCVDVCRASAASPGLSDEATTLLCETAGALTARLAELGWSARLVSTAVRTCAQIIDQYAPQHQDLLRRVASADPDVIERTLSEICQLSDHATAKALAQQILLNPATTADLAAAVSVRYLSFSTASFSRWLPYPTPLATALLDCWEITNSYHAAQVISDSEHPGEATRSYLAAKGCHQSTCTSILNKVAGTPQCAEVLTTLVELITTDAFEYIKESQIPGPLWAQLVGGVCRKLEAVLGDSDDAWHTMTLLSRNMPDDPVVSVAELAARVGRHEARHAAKAQPQPG